MIPIPTRGIVLLQRLQRQVLDECQFALVALHDLTAATQARDQDRLWYAARNVVLSVANISKALWTQGGKRACDRIALRESVNVGDASPLRATRFRNHFEHYDERLEKWSHESEHLWFMDRSVGDVRQTVQGPYKDVDVFRCYEPGPGLLRFWGDSYSLPEIMREVVRVGQALATINP